MLGGKVRFVFFESGDAAQRGEKERTIMFGSRTNAKTIFEAKIYGNRQKREF